MEVALYTRASTPRQQQQQTIAQQLRRLRDYVATHPAWHVADEHIYRADGYSGATLNRPGLDRLRDRAAMAAFECVLITGSRTSGLRIMFRAADERRCRTSLPRTTGAGPADIFSTSPVLRWHAFCWA